MRDSSKNTLLGSNVLMAEKTFNPIEKREKTTKTTKTKRDRDAKNIIEETTQESAQVQRSN